jgi:hypothetical protein
MSAIPNCPSLPENEGVHRGLARSDDLLRSLASELILKRCSRLSKAPITEAVIEIRANTETEWTEELITPRLKEKLSNNPNVKPERAWSQEWQFQADHEPEQRIGQ